MIYQYICEKCGKKVEKLRSVNHRYDKVLCPDDNENMNLIVLNRFTTRGFDHNVGS